MSAEETFFPELKSPSVWSMLKGFLKPREWECLQVGVTSCCPGHCVYCPHTTHSTAWESCHMAPETFAELWPLMLQTSRVHLQGWGEPLLHPQFMDFARLALRAGCRVSTTTCGLVMNEKLAVDIVDSGIDVVAFSLTGTDEASNAARAGVPFTRVEQSFAMLQRIRRKRQGVHLELHLAYLLLASNVDALQRLPQLMDDWGAHAVVISTLDCIPTPALREEAFLPHETEKIEAARRVLRDVGAKIRAAGHDFHSSLPTPDPVSVCREHAHRTAYVDANGMLSPCVYLNIPAGGDAFGRLVFGNVRNEPVLEALGSPAWTDFRSRLCTAEPPDVCRHCPKRFEAFV